MYIRKNSCKSSVVIYDFLPSTLQQRLPPTTIPKVFLRFCFNASVNTTTSTTSVMSSFSRHLKPLLPLACFSLLYVDIYYFETTLIMKCSILLSAPKTVFYAITKPHNFQKLFETKIGPKRPEIYTFYFSLFR